MFGMPGMDLPPSLTENDVLEMADRIENKRAENQEKRDVTRDFAERMANYAGLTIQSDSAIMRHAEPANKISVPEGMKLARVALIAQQEEEAEQVVTDFPKVFDFAFNDGVVALNRVLRAFYGAGGMGVTRYTLFGTSSPAEWPVVIGKEKRTGPDGRTTIVDIIETVPISEFQLAPMENATIDPSKYEGDDGLERFRMVIHCKKLYKNACTGLFQAIQAAVDAASIYRGQILQFNPSTGELEHQWREVDPTIVYSEETDIQFENAVRGKITGTERLRARNKRTEFRVICYGPLGTGKSQALISTAVLAKEYGMTVIEYTPTAGASITEFEKVFALAKLYKRSLILTEDINRFFPMNPNDLSRFTNLLDGLDKDTGVSALMTTNYLEQVDATVTRPGRITAIIEIGMLDRSSIERMLHLALHGRLAPDVDFDRVWEVVKDYTPSFIRSTFDEAEDIAIQRGDDGLLTTEALVGAALSLKAQNEVHTRMVAEKNAAKPDHVLLGLVEVMNRIKHDPATMQSVYTALHNGRS
jgi:hypothetical protein